jgi:hypothetical protein
LTDIPMTNIDGKAAPAKALKAEKKGNKKG